MAQRGPVLFTATPKSMGRLAIIFLVLAAVFGFLNGHRMKVLRANIVTAAGTSDASSGHGQMAAKSNAGTAGLSGAEQQVKTAEAEGRAAKAEAALEQAEK